MITAPHTICRDSGPNSTGNGYKIPPRGSVQKHQALIDGAPALKAAAIKLNDELFRLSSQLPHDDELIKAILAARSAIHHAGGF